MFASCSQDKSILVWRIDMSAAPMHVLRGHESIVYSCIFLPDSNRWVVVLVVVVVD